MSQIGEIRRARRLAALARVIARALLGYDHARAVSQLSYRAAWLHEHCARALDKIGVTVSIEPLPRGAGLFVSNHLSYLDILVYSAAFPCVFISKEEVGRWPVFGRFARLSGTIFVSRQSRSDAVRANRRIAECLAAGVPVILFPEGTTTNGERVLRFHSAMMQSAMDSDSVQATPCAVAYELPRGDVSTDVCWWGDMTLTPHVLRLLSKPGVHARIAFGAPVQAADRKELALRLHEKVEMLRNGLLEASAGQPAVV